MTTTYTETQHARALLESALAHIETARAEELARAVRCSSQPETPELLAEHAVALLLNRDLAAAQRMIREAMERLP